MDHIETKRLILRNFTEEDSDALFAILNDRDVNAFLPMFPLKNMEEAKKHLLYIESYIQHKGFYYAICIKGNNVPIGCIHVASDDSRDLGFCISRRFWHMGICTEACQAVINILKQANVPYITATHDVNNPRSGKVMQAIGMKYKYSYEELWQPKNFLVTFRMYQLNLDGDEKRIYKKYWNKYPVHFIEDIDPK